MADIKLRIEVNPNAESEFLGSITNNNARVSNTSINIDTVNQFIDIPVDEFDGSNGIVWNTGFINENGKEDTYIVFNDNDELDNVENSQAYLESEENPDEFFWGIVPANKEYSVRLTFTGATNLKDIIVLGDKVNNQFPIEAIVDGNTKIYSDDYKWAINLGSESDTHTIEFTKWNRANYNACITLIRVMLRYFEIDKFNGLKSVESLSQSNPQPDGLFYGSIENSGEVKIFDTNGEIYDLIVDGAMPKSNLYIDLYVNNNFIQKHISSDSSYGVNSRELSIPLGNKINFLDILKYAGFPYPDKSISLYDILFHVMKSLKSGNLSEDGFKAMTSNYTLINGKEIPIYEYLSQIEIPYPVIEYGKTYREVIDEICTMSQLNFYADNNDKEQFVSARPLILDKSQTLIKLPKNACKKPLDFELIVNNQYDGVEMQETFVSDTIDYDSVVASPTFEIKSVNIPEITIDNLYDLKTKYLVERSVGSSSTDTTKPYVLSFMAMENYYYSGIEYIPFKNKSNTQQIKSLQESLYRGEDETPTFTLTYDEIKSDVDAIGFTRNVTSSTSGYYDLDIISYQENNYVTTRKSQNLDYAIDYKVTKKGTDLIAGTLSATIGIDLGNKNTIKVTKDYINERYVVEYSILAGQNLIQLENKVSASASGIPPKGNNDMIGTSYRNVPLSLSISFYGDKRTISFEKVSASTENIENARTKASVSTGDLLQSNCVFGKGTSKETSLSNLIKENILADYGDNGISTATIPIACMNLYNKDGNIVKDWGKGEIIDAYDIVYFPDDIYPNGSQRYWRVTGRTFRYTGVPLLDLELQEVKIID